MGEVIIHIVFAPLLLLIFLLPLIVLFVGIDLFLDRRLSEWISRELSKKFKGDE